MLSSPNRSGSNRRRLIALVGSALAAVAVLAPAGLASAAPTPSDPAGHIGGIVPVHGNSNAASGVYGSGNLLYHSGGTVMHTNNVYVIYWQPTGHSVSSTYQSTINRFLSDLNATKGSTNNVYGIDTQYYDSSGNISNSTSFASSQAVVDNDVLPTSGCRDNATSVCLSDGQIQSEIRHEMGVHGWSASPTNFFMLLTGRGIGSCDSSSSCAFTQYCAYHGALSGLYYANMPYADTVPSACDSQQYPNGDAAADSEISLLTHEHNETITDQGLNAWFDRRGYEIGDKCAWNFGTPSGGSNGSEYNQTINGDHYYVQQEYSNRVAGCALHN